MAPPAWWCVPLAAALQEEACPSLAATPMAMGPAAYAAASLARWPAPAAAARLLPPALARHLAATVLGSQAPGSSSCACRTAYFARHWPALLLHRIAVSHNRQVALVAATTLLVLLALLRTRSSSWQRHALIMLHRLMLATAVSQPALALAWAAAAGGGGAAATPSGAAGSAAAVAAAAAVARWSSCSSLLSTAGSFRYTRAPFMYLLVVDALVLAFVVGLPLVAQASLLLVVWVNLVAAGEHLPRRPPASSTVLAKPLGPGAWALKGPWAWATALRSAAAATANPLPATSGSPAPA